MILGFAHLAQSCETIPASLKALPPESKVSFHAPDVHNHECKRSLLRQYTPIHDLALVQIPQQPTIEWTWHGQIDSHSQGPYSFSGFNQIQLQCADLSMEQKFWCECFGFTQESAQILQLRRPVSQWSCSLELLPISKNSVSWLDSQGFVCLALYTSNLGQDLEHALGLGAYDATPAFTLEVAGKPLTISLFRTPNGALCELIQVNRGVSK